MAQQIDFSATSEDFDILWEIVNGRRASSVEIRVPVKSLVKVLIDHQKACTALKGPVVQ